MLGNGKIINKMEKELLLIQMEKKIKEYSKKESLMDKDRELILT
jgi:hypothetical protein